MPNFQFFIFMNGQPIQCNQVKITILVIGQFFEDLNLTNLSNPRNLWNLSTSKKPTIRTVDDMLCHDYISKRYHTVMPFDGKPLIAIS